jgi:hypothetical protein
MDVKVGLDTNILLIVIKKTISTLIKRNFLQNLYDSLGIS